MKNLLNPLKKILTNLTGEETKDKNIVAVVDKIADAVETGGNNMNNPLIVHIIEEDILTNEITRYASDEPQTKHIFKLDKTVSELKEALENGRLIMV